jgi:hypothetical protein
VDIPLQEEGSATCCALLINRGTRSRFISVVATGISVQTSCAECGVSAMRPEVSSRSGEQSFETYHLLPHPTRRTAGVSCDIDLGLSLQHGTCSECAYTARRQSEGGRGLCGCTRSASLRRRSCPLPDFVTHKPHLCSTSRAWDVYYKAKQLGRRHPSVESLLGRGPLQYW